MQHQEIEALKTKVALLESKVDHLETELTFLNERLIACGFSEGIQSLKDSVEEILADQESYPFLRHTS